MELSDNHERLEEMYNNEGCNDATWAIIDSHYRSKSLVYHQIDSFNEFVERTIQQIILDAPPIELQGEAQHKKQGSDKPVRCTIKFGQIYLGKPTHFEVSGTSQTLFPNEARLRDLSYTAPLYVDITKTYLTNEETISEKTENQVRLGSIPIMVKSAFCNLIGMTTEELSSVDECSFDQGGYFIINGTEKVIIAQERLAANNVMVFTSKEDKYSIKAEIRSTVMNTSKGTSSFIICMKRAKKGQGEKIICTLPNAKEEIPLMILFRALGFETDRIILEKIVYDSDDFEMIQALMPSISDATSVQVQDVALSFIGTRITDPGTSLEKRKNKVREMLQKELLPHIGTDEFCHKRKAYFVGYMVHRMLQVALNRRPGDDRDHLGHKRVDTSGPLLSALFKGAFREVRQNLRMNAQKFIDKGKDFDVARTINSTVLSDSFNYALATGNWGNNRKSADVRTGVAQVLSRMTYMAATSNLRRVNAPIGRDGKLAKPRQMNATTWGKYCPAETPEGKSVGLLKNLALMAHVSIGCSDLAILEFLEDRGMKNLDDASYDSMRSASKIFVNGNWVGIHEDLDQIEKSLKDLKREMTSISSEISISRSYSSEKGCSKTELKILTDGGRLCRPLLVVENNRLLQENYDLNTLKGMEWDELISSGVVEYLDTAEEESSLIAITSDELSEPLRKYTHCEIHPSVLLGVCATNIPFPDHNQSPRNIYQSAMGKQSLGMTITNFNQRMDTMAHELFYPQKPLSATKNSKYINFQDLPAGINAITAIGIYTGYNQEDSIIMNSSSIDRGFFRNIFYKGYKEKALKRNFGPVETIEKPDFESMQEAKKAFYDKQGDDGIVSPGVMVSKDDAIIGKTLTIPEEVDELSGSRLGCTKKNCSMILKKNEAGVVDKVLRTVGKDGSQLVKVRVRSIRTPQIGDKFASRHGQKGTIGITFRQEDMPFTREGITPDLIINPHAIPSRMTIGHMIECLQSKGAALSGRLGDSTPFNKETNVEALADILREYGFHLYGNEVLYSGFTGRKIITQIFIGPTYYQKLKHMVEDKYHARPRGPLQGLNRQPMEGRARDGGLRFGEMERDCQIAHGAASFLKERLLHGSDAYAFFVCNRCGVTVQADLRRNKFECKSCNNTTDVTQIQLPYACKLLFQELMGMSICPRIIHRESEFPRLKNS